MGVRNGQLPVASLRTIPGTTRLIAADLLDQTVALRSAFTAWFGKALSITSAYRPLSTQESLFRARFTTSHAASAKIDPRTWQGRTWWRRPGASSAATPGTSVHGWGRAIDFGSGVQSQGSPEHRWMVAHAPAYGWTWPKQYRSAPYLEPWHFEGTPVPAWPGHSLTKETEHMTLNLDQRIDIGAGGTVAGALNGLPSISVGGALSYAAGGGWQAMRRLPTIARDVAATRAEVDVLAGAVATLAGGGTVTPTDLVAQVHQAARAGAHEGTLAVAGDIASDVVEAVRVLLADQDTVIADEVAALVLAKLGQALTPTTEED